MSEKQSAVSYNFGAFLCPSFPAVNYVGAVTLTEGSVW